MHRSFTTSSRDTSRNFLYRCFPHIYGRFLLCPVNSQTSCQPMFHLPGMITVYAPSLKNIYTTQNYDLPQCLLIFHHKVGTAKTRNATVIHSLICPLHSKLQPPQIYWQTGLRLLPIRQFSLNLTNINCASLHHRLSILHFQVAEIEISAAFRYFDGIPDSRVR